MSLLNFNKSVPVNIQKSKVPLISMKSELEKVLSDLNSWFEPFVFPLENFENLSIMPSLDTVEDENHFKVVVEMPGLSESDIKVSVEDGVLSITGEKTTSEKDKGKNYTRREISYGRYARHLSLPGSVDADKAKATFKKGMLWVDFPKKLEVNEKGKVIAVESAS